MKVPYVIQRTCLCYLYHLAVIDLLWYNVAKSESVIPQRTFCSTLSSLMTVSFIVISPLIATVKNMSIISMNEYLGLALSSIASYWIPVVLYCTWKRFCFSTSVSSSGHEWTTNYCFEPNLLDCFVKYLFLALVFILHTVNDGQTHNNQI